MKNDYLPPICQVMETAQTVADSLKLGLFVFKLIVCSHKCSNIADKTIIGISPGALMGAIVWRKMAQSWRRGMWSKQCTRAIRSIQSAPIYCIGHVNWTKTDLLAWLHSRDCTLKSIILHTLNKKGSNWVQNGSCMFFSTCCHGNRFHGNNAWLH